MSVDGLLHAPITENDSVGSFAFLDTPTARDHQPYSHARRGERCVDVAPEMRTYTTFREDTFERSGEERIIVATALVLVFCGGTFSLVATQRKG